MTCNGSAKPNAPAEIGDCCIPLLPLYTAIALRFVARVGILLTPISEGEREGAAKSDSHTHSVGCLSRSSTQDSAEPISDMRLRMGE